MSEPRRRRTLSEVLHASGAPSVLQQRLHRLIARSRSASGTGPMSFVELAAGIEDQTGQRVTHSGIYKILNGTVTDPHVMTLSAIADFFGVSVDYLLGRNADDTAVLAQEHLDEVMREAGVQQIALRAQGLSDETLTMLTTLIDQARKAEELDRPRGRVYRPKGDRAAGE